MPNSEEFELRSLGMNCDGVRRVSSPELLNAEFLHGADFRGIVFMHVCSPSSRRLRIPEANLLDSPWWYLINLFANRRLSN